MKQTIQKIFALMVLFLFSLAPVMAATATEEVQEVGITDPIATEDLEQDIEQTAANVRVMPGSAWYGFKVFGENMKLAFTFKAEDKLKVREQIAEERLAELYRLMNEGNDTALMNQIMNQYNVQVQAMYNGMEGVGNESGVVQQLQEKLQKHQQLLQQNVDKVPEQAKAAIMNAIQKQTEQREKLIEKFQNKAIETQNRNVVKTQVQEKIQEHEPGTGLTNETESVKDQKKDQIHEPGTGLVDDEETNETEA